MSSMNGQSMDYLYPPAYEKSNNGSLSSYNFISSSVSSREGEVHINAAYDCSESGDVASSSNHDYEDLQSVRTDVQYAQGPRRKTNDLYEPTGPLKERVRQITECLDDEDLQSIGTGRDKELSTDNPRSKSNDIYEPTGPIKHRVRQITECSDISTASLVSSDSFPGKKDSCLSKLILFLILAFSVAALVLVVLLINGTVGRKDVNAGDEKMQRITVQNLLRRIEDLNAKMVANVNGVRDNMTNTHEAFEELETELKQLNESVKELNNNDLKLTSTVNELTQKLRQNQAQRKKMGERLYINITQLQSRIKELRKNSNYLSNRVTSLEKGYNHMNKLMKTLQAINGAQNASHQDLQAMHNRLRDSLTAVNATLNNKLNNLGSSSGKAAVNFSMCKHRSIPGTPITATSTSYTSAFYKEPKDKRAMGITCSTNYAHDYQLSEISEVTKGKYDFKCTCRGVNPFFGNPSMNRTNCYLHVWACPI